MAHSHLPYKPLSARDLEAKIEKLKIQCKHPYTTRGSFIHTQALRKHLCTNELLEKLLLDLGIESIHHDGILNNCLCVFIILLQLNRHTDIPKFLQYDHLFDDHLPFLGKEEWPQECKEYFEEFYEKQWQFCVKRWEKGKLTGQTFNDDALLPIVESNTIREGTNSHTFKVELCAEYNGLDLTTQILVLKSCKHDDQRFYNNEVKSYQVLMRQPDVLPNIVTLHGYFKHNETLNLVLEYVNGGTLEHLFETGEPPQGPAQVLIFWRSFIKIFNPLHRMHGLRTLRGNFRATHQDIKPANIMISRVKDALDYNIEFKLIDFAFTRFQRYAKGEDMKDFDQGGTQLYSAPELCRSSAFLQRSKYTVTTNIDTWAFGAVLSETLVWCTLGREGLKTYRNRRHEATRGNRHLDKGGYEGCFHDGEFVLDVVQEAHKDALKAAEHDIHVYGITQGMINLVGLMLVDEGDRASDFVVFKTLESIIPDIRSSTNTRMPPPQPPSEFFPRETQDHQSNDAVKDHQGLMHQKGPASRPSQSLPSSSKLPGIIRYPDQNGYIVPGRSTDRPQVRFQEPARIIRTLNPEVTIKQAIPWLEGEKNNKPIKLPGIELKARLAGRDQIFLFDDSASMSRHWLIANGVKDIFEILGYITKDVSPCGLKAYFGVSRTYEHSKDRSRILRMLGNYHPREDSHCNMRFCIGRILQDWWDDNKKWLEKGFRKGSSMKLLFRKEVEEKRGLNVYVITNGAWEKEARSDCGVAEEIKKIYDKMMEHKVNSNVIGIEFIRFGNDPNSEGFKHLENMITCLQKLGVDDIVHMEPSDGNIWNMLLASFYRSENR